MRTSFRTENFLKSHVYVSKYFQQAVGLRESGEGTSCKLRESGGCAKCNNFFGFTKTLDPSR